MELELAGTVKNVDLMAGLHTICFICQAKGMGEVVWVHSCLKQEDQLEGATYLCGICSLQKTQLLVYCCLSWAASDMEQL